MISFVIFLKIIFFFSVLVSVFYVDGMRSLKWNVGDGVVYVIFDVYEFWYLNLIILMFVLVKKFGECGKFCVDYCLCFLVNLVVFVD